MELFTKKGKNRGRERLKIKTSPSSGIWRERLKTRLPLTRTIWRGTLKNSLSLTGNIREGNTEFQSFPCGGEDTTPTGINKKPPHDVTGVGEGRALRLPGPVSLPPPRNKGTQKKEKIISHIKGVKRWRKR